MSGIWINNSYVDSVSLLNSIYKNVYNIPKIIVPQTLILANIDVPVYTPPVYTPTISYVTYQDINYDENLRKQMVSFFLDRFIDKLSDDYKDIFKYVMETPKGIKLVSTIEEYNKNDKKFSHSKVAFLSEYFITKNNVKEYLRKYVHKNNINWYDLKKYKSGVLDYIFSKVKKNIKKNME